MIKPDEQSEILETSEAPVVTLTPVAAAKVVELLAQESEGDEQSEDPLGLRIFVAGGGCSGLQYGMTLDTRQDASDTAILIKHEDGDFTVFIDDMSLEYIKGSRVDYVDSLMGAGFTVDNPNAVSSCGCGQSFKTESAGTPGSCGCGH